MLLWFLPLENYPFRAYRSRNEDFDHSAERTRALSSSSANIFARLGKKLSLRWVIYIHDKSFYIFQFWQEFLNLWFVRCVSDIRSCFFFAEGLGLWGFHMSRQNFTKNFITIWLSQLPKMKVVLWVAMWKVSDSSLVIVFFYVST